MTRSGALARSMVSWDPRRVFHSAQRRRIESNPTEGSQYTQDQVGISSGIQPVSASCGLSMTTSAPCSWQYNKLTSDVMGCQPYYGRLCRHRQGVSWKDASLVAEKKRQMVWRRTGITRSLVTPYCHRTWRRLWRAESLMRIASESSTSWFSLKKYYHWPPTTRCSTDAEYPVYWNHREHLKCC